MKVPRGLCTWANSTPTKLRWVDWTGPQSHTRPQFEREETLIVPVFDLNVQQLSFSTVVDVSSFDA